MKAALVLVAAGRSRRFSGFERSRRPKQFVPLKGEPLFLWALSPFLRAKHFSRWVVVAAAEEKNRVASLLRRKGLHFVTVTEGGRERADSVRRGVAAVGEGCDYVFVHDAARPFVSRAVIENVFEAVRRTGVALAALPVSDTLKRVGPRGRVKATVAREGLMRAQTPQAFRIDRAEVLFQKAFSRDTDDVQRAERMGFPVEVAVGSALNFKVTTREDWQLCEALARKKPCLTRRG